MSRLISVWVRIEGKKKSLILSKDCTFPELFLKVRETCSVRKDDEMYLISGGEQILETAEGTIKSIGIANGCHIDFCVRVKGGSGRLKPLPGKIALSTEPCCISYDDDPNVLRAKMPCGCVIGVEEMTRYTESVIDDGGHKFSCPNCSTPWSYLILVRHVLKAVLSEKELAGFDEKVNDNFIGRSPKVQKCPSCNNFCERLQRDINRVICNICTAKKGELYEFCWQCLKPWVGGGRDCGNIGCPGVDSRLRHLQECERKTIGVVSGVPSVRCCPQCGSMINHKEACKHMTCKCGYSFCFVCLKPQNKKTEEWPCGTFKAICDVAPRQTSLPFP